MYSIFNLKHLKLISQLIFTFFFHILHCPTQYAYTMHKQPWSSKWRLEQNKGHVKRGVLTIHDCAGVGHSCFLVCCGIVVTSKPSTACNVTLLQRTRQPKKTDQTLPSQNPLLIERLRQHQTGFTLFQYSPKEAV